MTKEENLKLYEEWVFKSSAYEMALAIVGVDKMTVAPTGGTEYRDLRTAYLSGELFEILTDPKMKTVLEELLEEDLDDGTKKAVSLYYKELMKVLSIPKDEFVAFEELKNKAYNDWLEAKTKNDYSIFEPTLKEVIERSKKMYSYRNSDQPLYDQMLDDYEPGMTMAKYDEFFALVKERLVPLIKKIQEKPQIDTSFLNKDYPIAKQKEFMDSLLQYLGFTKDWGYQNETEHPFTSFTCKNDCRTTTKYLENNVASAILSTVHEVGHATYQHDVDAKYEGMILSQDISSGMHESQSRLMENYLGRTKAFWEYNYPRLQEIFPEQLGAVSLDDFVNAINASEVSLIRTEADELTYPLHIMVRYEIEKGLFSGELSTEGLDQKWNEMYEEYLGIQSDEPKKGILQDVHWSETYFGYFPTYALGSAFAAQFMNAMRKDIDVDACLRNNEFGKIVEWLTENIHRYGCRYEADEVLLKATGETFNPQYYIDYLEDKYTKLYNLKD